MAARVDVSRRNPRRGGLGGNSLPTLTTLPARLPALDALRGLAILAMVTYHFCFDLQYFGVTRWDFYHDPVWLTARSVILSSFLLIAGVSLVLADRNRPPPRRFWPHVGNIAACAAVVSAASYVLFPASWIWFGVLHSIVVSLIIARPLVRRPVLALIFGAIVIAGGNLYTNAIFDNRALGWLGFMTAKPRTEDYVPLFPWTGVLLLGIASGDALVRTEFRTLAFAATWPRWMAWLGRHSLATYMVHQPLLLGALFLAVNR